MLFILGHFLLCQFHCVVYVKKTKTLCKYQVKVIENTLQYTFYVNVPAELRLQLFYKLCGFLETCIVTLFSQSSTDLQVSWLRTNILCKLKSYILIN
jgi:hypothetical protein